MIANLIGSDWRQAEVEASLPVYNPATGEEIEKVPLSGPREVDAAVGAAVAAYGDARIAGLKSALAILAVLSIVALFLAQRIPTRQPGAAPV